MMKQFIIFIICFSGCKFIAAQPLATHENLPGPVGNTYAVIIGISNYSDPSINLEFSNNDVVVFANFLMSESGGSVPKAHIRLLIDSFATTGKVETDLLWLKNNTKKDDIVYFYFSGHGVLENLTRNEDGYLICYNTDRENYVNMGFSIDRLNGFANTLSIDKKASVIIITDACHSGTVAGNNFKGNNLKGEQAMMVKQNEIRIASCLPNQLSKENSDWGGGRGVFSYHLINGLQGGLADRNDNGIVTLGELKTYMDSAMDNDVVLKKNNDVQTPVIPVLKENKDFPLSKVVEADAIKIRQQVKDDSVLNAILTEAMKINEAEMMADPEAYFFFQLEKEDLGSLTDSLHLDSLAADEIAFALINTAASFPTPEKISKLNELKTILKDSERFRRFKVSLGSLITDKVQNVIVLYLKGDEAELERRRYYNSNKKDYDIYPKMLAAALKLAESEKDITNRTSVLLHYFKGVTLRLKIPLTANPSALIDEALIEQQKALAMEVNAAYIYNELGILYQYKNENTEAEKYFIKATEISSNWAIPHSNLCGLYAGTGKYENAIAACHIADSIHHATDNLKAGLPSVSVNLGFVYERQGNQLVAEEYYHQAIDINSRHYLPFERLGYVNMMSTNYARADSFFYEAALRKKGYNFAGTEWIDIAGSPPRPGDSPYSCPIDSSSLRPGDIFSFFSWGVQEYRNKNYANALRILKKVILLDKKNPLAFHYMGKIFYEQQQWEEADVMFKLAMSLHLDEDAFTKYVDSVKQSVIYPYNHECVDTFFSKSYYSKVEDFFFAANICQTWKHIEEAEMYLTKILKANPLETGAYLKLWGLYEGLNRYVEAEKTILDYAAVSKKQSDRELNAFYRRVIDKFPEDGNWYYRLGLVLYEMSVTSKAPNVYSPFYFLDSIVFFPKINKEVFIDSDIFYSMSYNEDKNLTIDINCGSPEYVIFPPKSYLESPDQVTIPGTGEYIIMADPIYTPRKDGIEYLKKAAGLLSEKETLADINFKIGNIYLWAGSKKLAHPWFEKSLALLPDNANARLTLVDIYSALYKNTSALQQLNYLYDSGQINFENRMLMAKFDIHAGEFEKANNLLDKAEIIYPYAVPEITDLRGRLNMMANKPKQAITFYETYMKQGSAVSRKNTSYTLARLYAKTGNSAKAIQWLETAIGYGFNYSFVLQNDPLMNNLRKTAAWQSLTRNILTRNIKQ